MMRGLVGVSLALALLAATVASAIEEESRLGPVTATVRLEPEAPVIGDPMTLTIEAVAEDGIEVLMPEFGEALERFSIIDFVPREKLEPDGRTRFSQRYTLQSPRSGRHALPAILIEFVDRRPGHDPAPEGLDAYELLTERLDFEVASVVLDASDLELSPPMGKLSARGRVASNLWLIGLGVGLILLGVAPFAYGAWVRMQQRAALRSAYELARAELDALLAGPRPTGDAVDTFFVELSGIVRRYLERRFQLRSPELTTERFLEQVSGSPDLSDSHQVLLRDFLRQSDLVKFAHVIPDPQDIQNAIDAVTGFIEETRDDAHPEPGAAEMPRGAEA
jgi:hypothetical protein